MNRKICLSAGVSVIFGIAAFGMLSTAEGRLLLRDLKVSYVRHSGQDVPPINEDEKVRFLRLYTELLKGNSSSSVNDLILRLKNELHFYKPGIVTVTEEGYRCSAVSNNTLVLKPESAGRWSVKSSGTHKEIAVIEPNHSAFLIFEQDRFVPELPQNLTALTTIVLCDESGILVIRPEFRLFDRLSWNWRSPF